eukprot:2515463-Rhodomonas_salina.1
MVRARVFQHITLNARADEYCGRRSTLLPVVHSLYLAEKEKQFVAYPCAPVADEETVFFPQNASTRVPGYPGYPVPGYPGTQCKSSSVFQHPLGAILLAQNGIPCSLGINL